MFTEVNKEESQFISRNQAWILGIDHADKWFTTYVRKVDENELWSVPFLTQTQAKKTLDVIKKAIERKDFDNWDSFTKALPIYLGNSDKYYDAILSLEADILTEEVLS